MHNRNIRESKTGLFWNWFVTGLVLFCLMWSIKDDYDDVDVHVDVDDDDNDDDDDDDIDL